MEAKQMQLQNFFIFLMDCICIVLSYILASYLRFGNLWGGYTKGIVLLRMGILLMSITLVYFIFNPNRNFFSRTKKQELIAVFRNILIMGATISMAAFLMQDAQKYSRLVYGYFCGIDIVVMYVSHLLYKKYMNDKALIKSYQIWQFSRSTISQVENIYDSIRNTSMLGIILTTLAGGCKLRD